MPPGTGMGIRISFYDPDKKRRKHKNSGFTMDWISELGWKKDPFANAPLADFEDERQEVNLFFIKKRRFGVIQAAHGMGKTTFLKWLAKELEDYDNIDPHYISLADNPSDEGFRSMLADAYRGVFGRGKHISTTELTELVTDKAKGRYVLLVDEGQNLTEGQVQTIGALCDTDAAVIITTDRTVKNTPKDELKLALKKRTSEQYEKIMSERIADAGGEGLSPFTSKVVDRMGKDTETTREFLDVARETAINIALKRVSLDDAKVDPESLADAEEEKVERKKGKKVPDEPKKDEEKKRTYDELIESLSKDLD